MHLHSRIVCRGSEALACLRGPAAVFLPQQGHVAASVLLASSAACPSANQHLSPCPATGVLASNYWIGLTDTSLGQWLWADGTSPNNHINHSPDDPYGHWGLDFHENYASAECIYAWSTKAYSRCDFIDCDVTLQECQGPCKRCAQ